MFYDNLQTFVDPLTTSRTTYSKTTFSSISEAFSSELSRIY